MSKMSYDKANFAPPSATTGHTIAGQVGEGWRCFDFLIFRGCLVAPLAVHLDGA